MPTKPMQKGEIRKLDKSNAPLFSEQWAVMGSGKLPYVVTHKLKETAPELVWQCSCPSWTQHTPREDCKHILKVKLKEKVSLVDPLTGDHAFMPKKSGIKELAQTVKNEKGGVSLTTFGQQGRKFR